MSTVTCWLPLLSVNMLYYLALQCNRIHPLSHSPPTVLGAFNEDNRSNLLQCMFPEDQFQELSNIILMIDHLLPQVLHDVSGSEKYPINNVVCDTMVLIGYSQFINWKKKA